MTGASFARCQKCGKLMLNGQECRENHEIYDVAERVGINRFFLAAHPGVYEALRTMEIEGVPFELLPGDIEPGDTYIAERNAGMKLLTCRKNDHENRWIEPVEKAYSYDTGECIRIKLLID